MAEENKNTAKILRGSNVNIQVPKDFEKNWLERKWDKMEEIISNLIKNNKIAFQIIVFVAINILMALYFYSAWTYWDDNEEKSLELCTGFGSLIALYVIIYFVIIFKLLKLTYEKLCKNNVNQFVDFVDRNRWVKRTLWLMVLVSIGVYIIIDTHGSYPRLITLVALALMLLFGYVFSKSPSRVDWRVVLSGFLLQFLVGLTFIRWPTGRMVLQCISNKVALLLSFGLDGAAFAYGEELVRGNSVFAFAALPTIYFFSMITEVLMYLGVLQKFTYYVGGWLTVLTHTTMCEGVIVVVNVFMGMTESLLLIRPYLPYLTASEMHLVMGCGFGTVSGYILAIYIAFGAQSEHLVTACVMSAPAAICFAKLLVPETGTPLNVVETQRCVEIQDKSVLAAATRGASSAVMLVLTIIAILVAFVAFMTMINAILTYLGNLVGIANLTLEMIFGKVFMPLAYIMGVPWEECEHVGSLIGIKTMVNEFVAYKRMGEMKTAGLLSPRSELIATYSLCGFTNPCSVGIMVGSIAALVPQQRGLASSVAVRAFFTGCGICFMTASIAGLLMPD